MASAKGKSAEKATDAPADVPSVPQAEPVATSPSVAPASPSPAKAETPSVSADAPLPCRVWAHGALSHNGTTYAPGDKLMASPKLVAELGGVLEVIASQEA